MHPEMRDYVNRLDAESTVLEAEIRKARANRELIKLGAGIWLIRWCMLCCFVIGFALGWILT